MHTFGGFFVATVAASMAAASHLDVAGGTFEVKQVRNPNFHGRSGPLALAKAYKKFGKPLPADLAAAVANIKAPRKRATGTEASQPTQDDGEYLCQVEIGTPAQILPMDFDTGSSDLWVFSSQTPSSESSGHKYYTPGNSSTAQLMSGATWEVQYGDGSSSSGDVYADSVTIGGLTVTNQAVECAESVSDEFTEDIATSGLVGLAFNNINSVEPTQQATWFSNVMSQLSRPLFSVNLKHDAASSYLFGGIDSSQYNGSITYTPVSTSRGYWSWTSTGYAVGSGPFQYEEIAGIADTGTTLMLLPDNIVEAYWDSVDSAEYSNSEGGYVFDCDDTLPSFTFGVSSSTITVPGTYMNYAPVSGSQCFGGLQSDDGIGFAIFGDVALKSAYVIFEDGDITQLGWASKST